MRVVLVDPSPMFRTGFRAALAAVPGADDIVVVGECEDGPTAARLVAALGPQLVVSDLHLGDQSGIELARELARTEPSVRILILASHGPEAVVHHAIAAGATGYVLKRQAVDVIIGAVKAVGEGNLVLPPGVSEPRRRRTRKGEEVLSPLDLLSLREREIFDLVISGCSNRDVAARLGISVKTIETHRAHINGKLRVRATADMVRLASVLGMLVPAPVPGLNRPANGVGPQ